MYNIIPLIIILISLAIIISIVVRKFSVLANLDLNTIQKERETKFKEQIIGSRIKRSFYKNFSIVKNNAIPLGQKISNLFKVLLEKLVDYKVNYKKEQAIKGGQSEKEIIVKLFVDAEECFLKNDIENAENKYIEIIGMDSKNIKAFKGLAELYVFKKEFNEAMQTYKHIIKLLDSEFGASDLMTNDRELSNIQLSDINFKISLILKQMENYSEALNYIDQALNLEKNNPRYLDTKLEICIINKEKDLALTTHQKLQEVNPENQKLAELKKQIEEIA